MSSGKCCSFRLSLNVLSHLINCAHAIMCCSYIVSIVTIFKRNKYFLTWWNANPPNLTRYIHFTRVQWVHCVILQQTTLTSCSDLTHWGRVIHICVGNLTIIGSDNGLLPGRRQAIIWPNAGILLIGPLGTNFSENLIEILTFSLTKMCLKMSSYNVSILSQPHCVNSLTAKLRSGEKYVKILSKAYRFVFIFLIWIEKIIMTFCRCREVKWINHKSFTDIFLVKNKWVKILATPMQHACHRHQTATGLSSHACKLTFLVSLSIYCGTSKSSSSVFLLI